MDISTLSPDTKSGTILSLIAALWATGVAMYLLFAPTYDRSVAIYGPNTSASEMASSEFIGDANALEVNGPRIVFAVTIPILLALAPLAIRKHRRGALFVAGALTLGFCVLGALSIGWFYLPSALFLLLGGAKTHAESAPAI